MASTSLHAQRQRTNSIGVIQEAPDAHQTPPRSPRKLARTSSSSLKGKAAEERINALRDEIGMFQFLCYFCCPCPKLTKMPVFVALLRVCTRCE